MKERRWMIVTLLATLALAACITPAPEMATDLETPTVILIPTTNVPSTPTYIPTSSQTTALVETPCPPLSAHTSKERFIFSATECADEGCELQEGEIAQIYLVNNDGSDLRPMYRGRGIMSNLQLSPDATRLAFTDTYGRGLSNVYVLDFSKNHSRALIPDHASQKVWGAKWLSNDELVFIKISDMNSHDFHSDLYLVNLSQNQVRQLTARPPRTSIYDISISPDRKQLLFTELLLDSNVTTVYRLNIGDGVVTELITFQEGDRTNVAWSPSGDQIVIYPTLPTSNMAEIPIYIAGQDSTVVTKTTSIEHASGDLGLLDWTQDQNGRSFISAAGIRGQFRS